MTRIHFQELIHSKTGGVFPYTTDELAFYMLDYIKSKHNINDVEEDSDDSDDNNIIEKDFTSEDPIIKTDS